MSVKYVSLDESADEFRLLELLPLAKSNEQDGVDRVRCRIWHVKQENAPPYRTLSYVWGDPTVTTEVLVAYEPDGFAGAGSSEKASNDFHAVQVTVNLESALRHLAREIVDSEPRMMWVDALCIDQKHKREKTAQVQRMTAIYQQADEVMVWLGPAADDSDEVMDVLEEIGREAEPLISDLNESIYDAVRKQARPEDGSHDTVDDPLAESLDTLQLEKMSPFQAFLRRISGSDPTRRAFPPLATSAFLARPWWTRIWVLQEVCVARRVTFHCGHKHLPGRLCFLALDAFAGYWQRVEKRMVLVDRSQASEYELQMMESRSGVLSIWRRLARETWRAPQPTFSYMRAESYSLEENMDTKRQIEELHAVSQHGRGPSEINLSVLANWCIAQPGSARMMATDPRDRIFALLGIAGDAGNLEIMPDYEMSVEDVYVRTAAALLRSGDFFLWFLHQSRSDAIQLPSWVIDWSSEFGRSSTRLAKVSTAGGDKQPSLEFEYAATGLPVAVTVKGVRVGRIKTVGLTWKMARRALPRKQRRSMLFVSQGWLRSVFNLLERDDHWRQDKDALQEVIFNLVKYDFDDEMNMFGLSTHQLFDAYKALLKPDGVVSKGPERGVMSFAYIVKRNTENRRVFVTDTGRVGLAPEAIQEDDTAVIFFGVNIPFILREADGAGYYMVGGCYINGLMGGEMLHAAEEGIGFKLL